MPVKKVKTSVSKDRGVFLVIMWALAVVGTFFTSLSIGAIGIGLSFNQPGLDPSVFLLTFINWVAMIIAITGIWKWKKWAVFLLAFVYLEGFWLVIRSGTGFLGLFLYLIFTPTWLFLWAIYRKWQLFD